MTPTTRRSSRSSTATSCGSASASARRSCGTTTAKWVDSSQPRRGSPAGSPPSAAATSPTRASARFRVIPRLGLASAELREALVDPRRRLRPDSRDAVEPSLRRSLAQLRQRPDPERMPELAHPLRRDAEQRSHADELRQRLRLELVQLGDAAGLDELAEPGLDAGADTGQLPHTSLPHERGHIGGRRADQVGRSAVRAHGVVAGAVEVEQGGEGVEAIGEGGVVHD